MRANPIDVFTIKEVARAAGVPPGRVRTWAAAAGITIYRGFVRQHDAVSLLKDLSGPDQPAGRRGTSGLADRPPRDAGSLLKLR
jgi:hypothetical protein